MEKHTLELLEFHSVLDELRSLCITEEGRALLGSQDIQIDTQEIICILDIVEEARSLLESGETEPDMSFPFIQGSLAVSKDFALDTAPKLYPTSTSLNKKSGISIKPTSIV